MVSIWAAKLRAEEELLPEQGIAGISIAPNGRIRVYVESPDVKVPRTYASYRVEKVVVGRIETLVLKQPIEAAIGYIYGQEVPKTARVRPIVGGVSIGNFKITAGTFTSRVFDALTGEKLILSNSHVLGGDAIKGSSVGDEILQPGAYDSGKSPDDVVGHLLRWAPIRPPPAKNLVDAALARPVSPDIVADEVLDLGVITDIEEAREGLKIQKSGRTTCSSTAVITDVNATVKVYGYPWGYAIFEDQVICSKLGEPGDSGSCVISVDSKKAVGLLFAGSDVITVLNKMTNVCNQLGISFSPPGAVDMSYWASLAIACAPVIVSAVIPVYNEFTRWRP